MSDALANAFEKVQSALFALLFWRKKKERTDLPKQEKLLSILNTNVRTPVPKST
ncbi:MAG: hypothetical protein RLZ33_112 [Bacteroidota bacterium]|jgi:hypothetical protein